MNHWPPLSLNKKKCLRVFFLALLFLPGFCSSSWAEDCGVRGNDGGADVVILDCEAAIPPTSPLRVAIPDGAGGQIIRGLNLVAPMISGAPNPAASKFRVDYIDNSTGTPTETIKAIGFISPDITACEELQMIGYHPAYPLNETYQLGADINCSATDSTKSEYIGSLWQEGYYEHYNHKGLDGIAGNADDGTETDYNNRLFYLNFLGTKGFQPIGHESAPLAPFSGTFDGAGHTITGLTISRFGPMGLFGVTNNATIKNVGLVGGSATAPNGGGGIGALVGSSTNTLITRCYATGIVDGNVSVGGLVGSCGNGLSIKESFATGSVSGVQAVGGLVGTTSGTAAITDSYATGPITSTATSVGSYAGGLVGLMQGGSITRCYAAGNVSGKNKNMGGLAGQGSAITNSYATGSVASPSVKNPTDATNNQVAGLSGSFSASIANCAWITSNAYNAAGWAFRLVTPPYNLGTDSTNIGEFYGTTHAVYQNSAPSAGDAWDFESGASPGVWKSRANGLPYLKWQDG